MAYVDSNTSDEDLIDSMYAQSDQRLAAFEATLKGVGGSVIKDWHEVRENAAMMPRFGREAAEKIKTLREDDSQLREYRFRKAEQTQDFHRTLIKRHNDYSVGMAERVEAGLTTGLLPKREKDSGKEQLLRDEITRMIGNRPVVQAAHDLLGKSAAHDGILLSDFGQALFRGANADDSFPGFKAQAVKVYMERKDGTDIQQASRKALAAYRAANISGSIASYQAAGLRHLTKHDR
jgi:hypothetical protein